MNKSRKYVDLHLHTTASDGNFTPAEVVKEAKKLGFSAVAITDHDTIEGLEEGIQTAEEENLELVPGIELNTDYQDTEVHVLGYYIDYCNQEFIKKLHQLKRARIKRIEKMVKKLNNLGIDIKFTEVKKLAQGAALGRAHVAQLLVEREYVNEWGEAFENYIGKSSPAYVSREKLTPKEAIKLINKANGIPIIAHPGLIENDELLPRFIEWGARGLEVYHTEHNPHDIERYKKFTVEKNLLMTGGSDCHGPLRKEGVLLGQVKAPYSLLERLKQYKNKSIK